MYRLQLIVHPKGADDIGVISKRLHGFIFKAIQRIDPDLSAALHDRKDRQLFSVYPLLKKKEIRIHSPEKNVISCLQQYFLQDPQIDINDWKGEVQEVKSRYFSTEKIDQAFSSRFTLRFLTPTTFYQWGNYYPLPELQRLFSSAIKIYEICGYRDIQWEELEFFIRKMRIEHVSVTTHRVNFGKFNIIGFRGSLTLNMKELPPEKQKQIWRMVVYTSLMGFGYKTAWGMGQTRLEPFEDLQTPSVSVNLRGC